jgi:phosphate transport system ATP-binding protein
MNNVFQVEDFSLNYGEKEVLHHINLTIAEHAVTAFIGPSGCGKSSLLRAFNRLNDLIPDAKESGKILYHDKPIEETNPLELRSQVGMLFQAPSPFPMSIYDNVAYARRLRHLRGQIHEATHQRRGELDVPHCGCPDDNGRRARHGQAVQAPGGQEAQHCQREPRR